jgi:hypothetical protein
LGAAWWQASTCHIPSERGAKWPLLASIVPLRGAQRRIIMRILTVAFSRSRVRAALSILVPCLGLLAATPVFAISANQLVKLCQKTADCEVVADGSDGTTIVANVKTGAMIGCPKNQNCHQINRVVPHLSKPQLSVAVAGSIAPTFLSNANGTGDGASSTTSGGTQIRGNPLR